MNLYKNAFSTTYEEIKGFFPNWYADVKEMDAIWRAQGAQFDGVRAALNQIVSNAYVATADEYTIGELERFLRITPYVGQSLEERRQVVSLTLNAADHIGAPEIRDIVSKFTDGGNVSVNFAAGVIAVYVEYTRICSHMSCYKALLNAIPAHLSLDMKVRYALQREAGLYLGCTLKTTKTLALEMPSIDTETMMALTDETDAILIDDDGTVLLDGLEVTGGMEVLI